MKSFLCLLVIFFSSNIPAASVEVAVSMVPRGKVIEHFGRDFIIKTPAGTKIGIEFTSEGKFEEAKGHNLNKGDELEPGEGLISLSTAAQNLMTLGIKPEGFWNLEQDKKHGWVYEFNKTLVDAKTGKVLLMSNQ